MRLIFLSAVAIFSSACSSEKNEDTVIPNETQLIIGDANFVDSLSNSSTSEYSFEVFETPNLGWGYKIYDNGILFINQPHIPAIQGNKGFSSKDKAQIAADFAIFKMEQGLVPPTISPDELDSLGVLD